MIPRRNLLALALFLILCTLGLAGWHFAGPVAGDLEETVQQWAEYERLAKQYPYQER